MNEQKLNDNVEQSVKKNTGRPKGAKDKKKRKTDGYFEPKRPELYSEEFGKRVEFLYKHGVPLEVIARMENTTTLTLRTLWGQRIENARQGLNAQVAQSLFINATKKMNVAAQIFWLKCRAGWKDYDDEQTKGGLNITLQSSGPRPSQIHIAAKVDGGDGLAVPEQRRSSDAETVELLESPSDNDTTTT